MYSTTAQGTKPGCWATNTSSSPPRSGEGGERQKDGTSNYSVFFVVVLLRSTIEKKGGETKPKVQVEAHTFMRTTSHSNEA